MHSRVSCRRDLSDNREYLYPLWQPKAEVERYGFQDEDSDVKIFI